MNHNNPDDITRDIGKRMRDARIAAKLAPSTAARRIGIHVNSLTAYEHGHPSPSNKHSRSPRTIPAVVVWMAAKVYDTPIADLFTPLKGS